jgi:hypothetical protein
MFFREAVFGTELVFAIVALKWQVRLISTIGAVYFPHCMDLVFFTNKLSSLPKT